MMVSVIGYAGVSGGTTTPVNPGNAGVPLVSLMNVIGWIVEGDGPPPEISSQTVGLLAGVCPTDPDCSTHT
jgi:hypothetical protein